MSFPHIVLAGERRTWESDGRLSIGRLSSCEIVLDDVSVSRRHAEVFFSEAGWVVRDLGSTNGTFLNGARLGRTSHPLHAGDHLQPGKVALTVVKLTDDAAACTASADGRTNLEATGLPLVEVLAADFAPERGPGATISGNAPAGVFCADRERHGYMQTMLAIAQAVDARDPFTIGHSQRVTDYVLLLANAVQVSPAEYRVLQLGTPLHDIGKISTPDAVLQKAGRLNPAEYREIQSHPLKGAAMLETLPDFGPALPIVRSHHEHWDGRGYPDGLIGEAISPLARMVTVADVFDALTSDRPYRRALTVAEACAYVEKNSGTLFDPTYAHAFLDLRAKLEHMVIERGPAAQTVSKYDLDRIRMSLQGAGIPSLVRPT